MREDQQEEMLSQGDDDALLLGGAPQQFQVPGIRAEHLRNVVPGLSQPQSDSPAGATVDEKLHLPAPT